MSRSFWREMLKGWVMQTARTGGEHRSHRGETTWFQQVSQNCPPESLKLKGNKWVRTEPVLYLCMCLQSQSVFAQVLFITINKLSISDWSHHFAVCMYIEFKCERWQVKKLPADSKNQNSVCVCLGMCVWICSHMAWHSRISFMNVNIFHSAHTFFASPGFYETTSLPVDSLISS